MACQTSITQCLFLHPSSSLQLENTCTCSTSSGDSDPPNIDIIRIPFPDKIIVSRTYILYINHHSSLDSRLGSRASRPTRPLRMDCLAKACCQGCFLDSLCSRWDRGQGHVSSLLDPFAKRIRLVDSSKWGCVPDRVGCPWQVRAMSSVDAPYSIARTHSPINSPAPGKQLFRQMQTHMQRQRIRIKPPDIYPHLAP